MTVSFVYLSTYERDAKGLVTREMEAEFEAQVSQDPAGEPVITGTNGWRKIRIARPGTGKSGGVRVIYLYRVVSGRVYVGRVYAKNKSVSLSAQEKKALRTLAPELR